VAFADPDVFPGPDERPSAGLARWVQRRLLAWFDRSRRDLPWRRDRDPYRIWVSEVMLQQTTVAAVIPYFERFLTAFPTVRHLAEADEHDVLRLWEGLGYYRRARHLHQAARQLAAHHPNVPNDPDLLANLPGLGRYTRNALLSQAFDRRLPVLEANSRRVLCRLFGRQDDPTRGPAVAWLWQLAEDLLPARRVGDYNQAVMELGALVCTPEAPDCPACPLAARCTANRLGLQGLIPLRPKAAAPTEIREAAAVVSRRGRVLLVQRPEDSSRWASLWEFPHGPLMDGETVETGAIRLVRELTGMEVALGPELATLRHGVTRFRITLVCFEARATGGRFRSSFYAQGRWVKPASIAEYPVSAPQRRLAQMLTAPRQGRLF